MDIEKYLTYEVIWKPCLGEDPDTMMLSYGEDQTIKCFRYGKTVYVRDGESTAVESAQVYLVTDKVKPRDILDGQVVKSVNMYPESWDSRQEIYEAMTWD